VIFEPLAHVGKELAKDLRQGDERGTGVKAERAILRATGVGHLPEVELPTDARVLLAECDLVSRMCEAEGGRETPDAATDDNDPLGHVRGENTAMRPRKEMGIGGNVMDGQAEGMV
jgi:hypothetical protein